MADFDACYEKTLNFEGGYRLDTIPNDRGGWTYAGISRRHHPDWVGWEIIDMGLQPAPETVQDFFDNEFWRRISGDLIRSNGIAWPIYDHAVTSGIAAAVKMAQKIVGVTADGIVGPVTIAAVNQVECHHFKCDFFAARVRYYVNIALRDRTQRGFLLGWITRALAGL